MTDQLPAHGGQLRLLAERFGLRASELLDFSANINPDGPPAAVLSALRSGIDDPSAITQYPDLELQDLRQAIADCTRLASGNIIAANGFVPLLESAIRSLNIKRCLVPIPAFVEYRKTLRRLGVEVSPGMLSETNGFAYEPEVMLSTNCDAILLANPQNPSGVLCDFQVIEEIVARAAEEGVYVLLDEAFIDYAPEHSLTASVAQYSNLVVFRSVTKFFAMPGLRVAYAAANDEIAARLREDFAPWPITTLASSAVIAALQDSAYAERTRERNEQRRSALQAAIEALGIHTYPSAANFLLLKVPEHIEAHTLWQQMLREHGIVLRSCFNYEGLSTGHLRAAVRTGQENARLVQALHCEINHAGNRR